MKVNNQLIKIVKNLEGTLLGFGIEDDKVLDTISENPNITECNLLNLEGVSDDTSSEGKKLKYISIRNLRKKFKKKKTNIIIASDEEVKFFYTNFIKDSIYLANQEIYLFFQSKDCETVIKRYERYHTKVERISCSDGVILRIDVSKVKSTKMRDTRWDIVDKISNVVDIITDIMTT